MTQSLSLPRLPYLVLCALLLLVAYFASGWLSVLAVILAAVLLMAAMVPAGHAVWLGRRPAVWLAFAAAQLARLWPLALLFVVAGGAMLVTQGRRAMLASASPAVPAIGEQPAAPPPARGQLPDIPLGEIRVFGREGSGPGQFREPHGLTISPNGEIAVADTGNKRIQILTSNGQFLRELKLGREPFLQPMSVAYTKNGELVVLDAERASIEQFAADGRLLSSIDKLGYFPRGMNLDKDGNYLIADTGGSRIIRVSPTGQVLFGWGEKGKGAGQWTEPTDVIEDADGNIYGVDPTNKVLQKFAADGTLLASVGIEGAGSVHGPKLAIEPGGTLLVSIPEQHIFRRYDRTLKGLGEFGGAGAEPGRFRLPTAMLRVDNLLFISDSINHRVQRILAGAN